MDIVTGHRRLALEQRKQARIRQSIMIAEHLRTCPRCNGSAGTGGHEIGDVGEFMRNIGAYTVIKSDPKNNLN